MAEKMLQGLCHLYSSHHGIDIVPTAVTAAVQLSVRTIKGRSLPDKAIDVLDEACCLASCEGAKVVEEVHVQTVVSRWQAPPWQRQAGPLSMATAWMQRQWSRL